MWAWNNLGRNVVFADAGFRPLAVAGETFFPDDDERSQYDLDVHAILEVPGPDLVLVLNHLGLVRTFPKAAIRQPGPVRRIDPTVTVAFVDDVERTVAVGDRLVGSRPRSQRGPGLLVSEPVPGRPDGARLGVDVQAERCGQVTALVACAEADDSIVIGGDGRISLAPVVDGVVGPARWELDVDFSPAVLQCANGLVWAAGSERRTTEIDDYDWDQVRGGGFVGLDPDDGRVVVTGRFDTDLAWGNGGVAVVIFAGILCGIGRSGRLALFDARTGDRAGVIDPIGTASLGIAHAAAAGDRLLVGWNRDGYRLHAWTASTTAFRQMR
jgi:hypothetical protein